MLNFSTLVEYSSSPNVKRQQRQQIAALTFSRLEWSPISFRIVSIPFAFMIEAIISSLNRLDLTFIEFLTRAELAAAILSMIPLKIRFLRWSERKKKIIFYFGMKKFLFVLF